MRLSEKERDVIVTEAKKAFGLGTGVILFGSRTIESRRGGDIDLLIKPAVKCTNDELLKRKINMLIAVEQQIGEQKIDIIIQSPGDKRVIVKTANETGVALC